MTRPRRVAAKWVATALGTLGLLISSHSAADTLRVASYNVWGVPVGSPSKTKRLRRIAEHLASLSLDVAALQELWQPDDAAMIGAILQGAGLTEQRYFSGQRGSGLWIASRYPITAEHFVAFRAGSYPLLPWHLDWTSSKGVAVIGIRTPGGPLLFANTHLQSDYRVGSYDAVRFDQIVQASQAIAKVRSSQPLLWVGDFNAKRGAIELEWLLHTQRLTASGATEGGLDHMLTSAGTKAALQAVNFEVLLTEPELLDGPIQLSDHPLLITSYSWRPAPTTSPASTAGIEASLLQFHGQQQQLTSRSRWASLLGAAAALWLIRRSRGRFGRGWAALALILLLYWGLVHFGAETPGRAPLAPANV